MIETTKLPKELVIGEDVEKRTIEGIDEIQYLCVSPYTSIKRHGHDNQWEVWVRLSRKTAYVCLQNEEHELINNTSSTMILMAIKGHINYSYSDLAAMLYDWGFSVHHGSLIISN